MTRNRQLLKVSSPHPEPRLPSPACAAVFKLTILKLLKRAWQVIYSVAEDSNFTVHRQDTQLHQKIHPLMEHRFNMVTIPGVCGHNALCSFLPVPEAPSKCYYTVSSSKGPPVNLHRINQIFHHEGWLSGTCLWKEPTLHRLEPRCC